MNRRIGIMLFVAVVLLLDSTSIYAQETGLRTIDLVGCDLTPEVCYVHLSGSPVGPTQCNSIAVRWNLNASPNGKSWLSLFISAFLSGRQVNLFISSNCSSDYANYPTFVWGYIR
jgi:hypothetical protein